MLSHEDFQPHLNASTLLTTRYRNLWLLCVLFGLTTADKRPVHMTEWHIAALVRVAEKTPPIVLEEAHDFVTAELEYNPVLRQDYVQGVRNLFGSVRYTHLFIVHSKACCDLELLHTS